MSKKENRETARPDWQQVQDKLSEESGVAVVMVEGQDSTVISASNNNSICRTLQASAEFAPLCARFCGQAYTQGLEIGKPACFRCHAGLTYATVPVEIEPGKKLVAIVGRVFRKASDYVAATEKARSGDWQKLPPAKLLENVLMTGSLKELENTTRRLQELSGEEKHLLAEWENAVRRQSPPEAAPETAAEISAENNVVLDISPIIRERNASAEARGPQKPGDVIRIASDIPLGQETIPADQISEMVKQFHRTETSSAEPIKETPPEPVDRKQEDLEEMAAGRSLFNSLLDQNYNKACISVLKFLAVKYQLRALAWLEKKGSRLETYLVGGTFKGQNLKINLPVSDPRLIEAINQESALELLEKSGEVKADILSKILLFPIVVGGELRSALVIGDEIADENKRRSLARFCRQVSVSLEILRLRDEIERNALLSKAVRKFNEGLNKLDSEEFWSFITQASAELLQAELGSLLIYDEDDESLTAKASVGKAVAVLNEDRETIGKRVAERVLQNGKPLVVSDVGNTGLPLAPADRKYKTRSFLSYPIVIGAKKIGVLNMTDKVDGSVYDEYDLELLNAVTPHLAVALDRAKLERKAGKYEQLSITDPLTGLLNRRYLEERLAEEIKRSRRYGYPMSFMMIDVDEFKSYNDNFLHTAGDKVLQQLAHCMKDCLRGADVASRYGGEEFSILLPQTALTEARTIAERIREKVAGTAFPHRKVTISVGVAAFAPNIKTPEELISAADKALYQAKNKGRNNVQVYQNLPTLNSSIGNVSEVK